MGSFCASVIYWELIAENPKKIVGIDPASAAHVIIILSHIKHSYMQSKIHEQFSVTSVKLSRPALETYRSEFKFHFTTHEFNRLEVTNLHKLLFLHWRLMKLEIMHISSSTISGKSLRIHKLSVLLNFCYISVRPG